VTAALQKHHLEAHVKTVHDNIKDNKCTKCDYAALQQHHLEAHVKIAVHDDQPVRYIDIDIGNWKYRYQYIETQNPIFRYSRVADTAKNQNKKSPVLYCINQI
jgi:hypothetical protein